MLTLLSPVALWSFAALALPLALHLWRQPPRTVRLGSLRFLQVHTGRRFHDLCWRERLLLLVRLGLLAVLAGLLARPAWQSSPSRSPQRWILLDPAGEPTGPSLERLHTLQAAGYATRRLPGATPVDLWSLLRETDASLPAGSTLAVFSPARLASLRGVRPTLRSKVEWVKTADSSMGYSVLRPDVHPAKPPSVAIFHDTERAEDARYLAAAVRAALEADGNSLSLLVDIVRPDLVLPPGTDWTFWLSATAPPASMDKEYTQLFQDDPQATSATAGWIVPQPGTAFPSANVRLWQRGPAPAGAVCWTDEHGVPLLTFSPNEHGARWHFASRFHPAWTDLPRTTTFPAWLRSILLPAEKADVRNDFRLAAVHQAEPSEGPAISALPLPPADAGKHDLHWLFWTVAACLFVAERCLSHRRRPGPMITASTTPSLAAAR